MPTQKKTLNVSVVGANGYTGLELMNILSRHGQVSVKRLVSVSNAGSRITDIYPSLIDYRDQRFEGLDIDAIAKDSDAVFSCLPHAASAALCSELYRRGVKIIDLSADFRYKDCNVYESIYKVSHPDKRLLANAVYGLPELYRKDIASAAIVGNPGCYTTCSILPLFPPVREEIVDADDIIIDAKSGVSGAGRKAEISGLFAEVNENFRAYSVTNHRHTSEIEQEISIAARRKISLSFTPHLLPVTRGILATIYLKLKKDVSEDDIQDLYMKYYANEPFVIIEKEKLPSLSSVKRSNYISIGFAVDKRLNRLVIVSCLDNLIKGASGQAVQNMNIMFGIDERQGLTDQACYL